MANLNSLKRVGKRPYRRVGRGQSSTRGKQSGRGGKGQTARAGHKIRPAWRDVIKKLPKRRGYGKNRGRTVVTGIAPLAISVSRLEKMFDAGEISVKALREHVALKKGQTVKLVGGETSKKFTVKGVAVSASAKAAIEKAGGSIQ